VSDLVRITKEKVKFSKGYEQTFSTEIFRVAKVIQCVPQLVYELTDLQNSPFEASFTVTSLSMSFFHRRRSFK